jgi:hypothetical protein
MRNTGTSSRQSWAKAAVEVSAVAPITNAAKLCLIIGKVPLDVDVTTGGNAPQHAAATPVAEVARWTM